MRDKKSLGLESKNNFIRAKKSLGQNFLKSKKVLERMISGGEISKKDTVLEIGPGKGFLTEELLKNAKRVIAVEKDDGLVEILKQKFKTELENNSLQLVHTDILDFYPGAYGLKPASYKIVANIPYNITGAILKKFLTEKEHPSEMVLMVQLEVARRIMARDGKESLLSLSVKAYGVPKMIMKVEARYFSPVPKVDSAVLRIKDISKADFLKNKDREKEFWHLIHKSFSHKRKKLGSNLKNTNWTKKGRFLSLKDKRAEDLSLKDWQDLLK